MEKRVRKKSKKMSESSAPYEDEEPPKKKAKRTKSTTVVDPFPSDSGRKNNSNSKSTQRNGSKMLVVSVDFTSNDNLRLGGVPLSQLSSPTQAKGRRSKRSTSMSSHSNSIPEEVVSTKPVKINFKNPKFCFTYLAGNKKKTWKNFKQIMTAEKGLTWRADDPRFSSLEAPPLLKPAKKYSDISGLLAKYTDPLTSLFYSSAEEFQIIRTLTPDMVQSYLALRGKMTIT